MQGESEKDMTADKANKIAMEILNTKSRIENRKQYNDLCDTCKHESCRNCDGRSKYKEKEEQAAG